MQISLEPLHSQPQATAAPMRPETQGLTSDLARSEWGHAQKERHTKRSQERHQNWRYLERRPCTIKVEITATDGNTHKSVYPWRVPHATLRILQWAVTDTLKACQSPKVSAVIGGGQCVPQDIFNFAKDQGLPLSCMDNEPMCRAVNALWWPLRKIDHAYMAMEHAIDDVQDFHAGDEAATQRVLDVAVIQGRVRPHWNSTPGGESFIAANDASQDLLDAMKELRQTLATLAGMLTASDMEVAVRHTVIDAMVLEAYRIR